MLFGVGLAFFLGKPLIGPTAPHLPSISLGWWSALGAGALGAAGQRAVRRSASSRRSAVRFVLRRTRWGLVIRTVGESADAARAMGYDVTRVRLLATMAGGFLAGVGGSFLSLFYPGSWNEGLSSGQGLMAVALVIFARWDPVRCLCGVAAVRRRERARPGAAVGRASPRATTCSTPRPTRSRWRSSSPPARAIARCRAAGRAAGGASERRRRRTAVASRARRRVPPGAGGDRPVGKRFGSVRALDDVSLRAASAGTVHALLGENGAGKSTLVKCIMGYYRGRRGPACCVGGVAARIKSPRDAAALGIGMVYQHFTLVDNMTVAENLVLARREHPVRLRLGGRARRRSRAFMERMPFQLDPAQPGAHAGRGREAEARDPEAALSRQLDRDPRRADVGADARRGRRGAGPAARDGARTARLTRPDDLAQVPRGDAVRRRGDGAAPRAPGRRAAGSPTSRPTRWRA